MGGDLKFSRLPPFVLREIEGGTGGRLRTNGALHPNPSFPRHHSSFPRHHSSFPRRRESHPRAGGPKWHKMAQEFNCGLCLRAYALQCAPAGGRLA